MASMTATQKQKKLAELEDIRILLIEAMAHTSAADDRAQSRRLRLLLKSVLGEVDLQIRDLRSSL